MLTLARLLKDKRRNYLSVVCRIYLSISKESNLPDDSASSYTMKFANVFNNLVSMGFFKTSPPPPPAGAGVFERLCWLHHRVESVAPIFAQIRPNFSVATAFDLLNLPSKKDLSIDAVHAA